VGIVFSNGIRIRAILDSGSEVNLLSERVYDRLIKSDVEVPVLPLENIVLITASGRRSKKIRSQALVEFAVGRDIFEGVFMISPQVTSEAIIGCQLLKEYGISINFERGSISYDRLGCFREQLFDHQLGSEDRSDGRSSEENPVHNPSPTGQRPDDTTADRNYPTPFTPVLSSQTSTQPRTERADISPEREGRASGPISIEGFFSSFNKEEGNSTLINGAENDRICCDQISLDRYETAEAESRRDDCYHEDAAQNKELLLCRVESEPPTRIHAPTPEQEVSDPRSLLKSDLSALIGQVLTLRTNRRKSYIKC
jgi:hypothetical protein